MEKQKISFSDIQARFIAELHYLKEYIQFNEEKITERNKKLSLLLEEDISSSPTLKDELMHVYSEDFIKHPRFFYHSTFISMFSLFEFTLNRICDRIIEETLFPIKLKDLNNKAYVKGNLHFLTKIVGLDLTDKQLQWHNVDGYQKVRNLLIHENGMIDITRFNNSNLENLLKHFNGIEYSPNQGLLYLKDIGFLREFTVFMVAILTDIFNTAADAEYQTLPTLTGRWNRPFVGEDDDFDLPF